MPDDERDDDLVEREDPPTQPLRPSGGRSDAPGSRREARSSRSEPAEPPEEPAEGISEHEDFLWAESVRKVPRSARRQQPGTGDEPAEEPLEPLEPLEALEPD